MPGKKRAPPREEEDSFRRARQISIRTHGVVVSHPLRMQKALGANPSVSIVAPTSRNTTEQTCLRRKKKTRAGDRRGHAGAG